MVKRYKLLRQENWPIDKLKKGHLYLGDYKLYPHYSSTIIDYVKEFSNEWEEIILTKLPKYWAVKNDGSQKYTNTLKKYMQEELSWKWNCSSFNYCGYDGNLSYNGTQCHDRISRFINNPVELSLEEFIELTTKKETKMNRKLVGYILSTEGRENYRAVSYIAFGNGAGCTEWDNNCPSMHPNTMHKLKDANILNKWFDAVYEDEYKVGDWVTYVSGKHITAKILRKCHTFGNCWALNETSHDSCHENNLRKATPEEIAKATIKLPVIAGYKGSYSKSKLSVSYGCKTIYIKTIREMLSFNVTSLTIEDNYDIYESDMKDILKYVDNQ